MATNTSATGGRLVPSNPPAPPAFDNALEDIFQALVSGVSGIAGANVRPRWQEENPQQPARNVTWCALGVGVVDTLWGAVITHDGAAAAGEGADLYEATEIIGLTLSFYGPQGQAAAAMFRDGMSIPQNSEALGLLNIVFVSVGKVMTAPDLLNSKWRKRYDVTAEFRRKVTRTYPVLNLLSATVTYTTN